MNLKASALWSALGKSLDWSNWWSSCNISAAPQTRVAREGSHPFTATGRNSGLAGKRSQGSSLGRSWKARHLLEQECGSGKPLCSGLCLISGYGSNPARWWRALMFCPAWWAPPAKPAHRCYMRFQLRIQVESSKWRARQSHAKALRCKLCALFSRRNPEIWV